MQLNLHGTKMKVLLHIAAWAILLGLPFYNSYRWNVPKAFIWGFYINSIISGIIFYSNYLVIIPRLFFKPNRLKFYIAIFLLTIAIFMVSLFSFHVVFDKMDRQDIPPDRFSERRIENTNDPERPERRRLFRIPFGPMSVYNYSFNALVFTIFAIGLRVLERHAEIEKRQKELEKEKLNSELAFLKNQISPHFFFNTLNNIYSLIEINTQDSQNAVLKLSKLMRYLLYESEHGEVKLSSEIDFMNNYIDLMRLRLSDKVKLNITFPLKFENINIPPLLFISIIENAFKHGISYREKSFIDIGMDVSEEMINFNCKNSLVGKRENESPEGSGIGLENLKKRLGLLFPDKHELIIESRDSVFSVTVRIFLNKA